MVGLEDSTHPTLAVRDPSDKRSNVMIMIEVPRLSWEECGRQTTRVSCVDPQQWHFGRRLAIDDRAEPKDMAVLMDAERDSAHGPGREFAPNDLRDDIFASIVQLTDMRVNRMTLADLSDHEVQRLVLLLGRKEVEEILRIKDLDLAVYSQFTTGVTTYHGPFAL